MIHPQQIAAASQSKSQQDCIITEIVCDIVLSGNSHSTWNQSVVENSPGDKILVYHTQDVHQDSQVKTKLSSLI